MKLFGRITRAFRRKTKLVLPRRHAFSPEVMLECFEGATNSNLWKGMDMLIDQMVLECVQETLDHRQRDTETKFYLGGAAFAANLKARMIEQVNLANRRSDTPSRHQKEAR